MGNLTRLKKVVRVIWKHTDEFKGIVVYRLLIRTDYLCEGYREIYTKIFPIKDDPRIIDGDLIFL